MCVCVCVSVCLSVCVYVCVCVCACVRHSDQGVPLAANQIQYSLLSRTVGNEVKDVCDELGTHSEKVCALMYMPCKVALC